MDATRGFVVPAGGGKHLDMAAPGRFAALKLLGHETNESIMLFEETLPAATKSLFHLHRDSDEVAWVLAGEITFRIGDDVSVGGPGTCAFFPRDVPHAWKNTGSETGRVLFLYTPAAAGGYVEELLMAVGAGKLSFPAIDAELRGRVAGSRVAGRRRAERARP
jgi:quercetin dioxygenase-like cupin family protein